MKFECGKVKINKRNTIFWSLIAKHIAKCGHIGILPAVDAAAFVMKKNNDFGHASLLINTRVTCYECLWEPAAVARLQIIIFQIE